MNTKYLMTGIGLVGTFVANAAGINWSYDGEKTYQKALIVWTDAGLGGIGADPKQAIANARQDILDILATASPYSWSKLVWLGDKNRDNTIIKADQVDNPGPKEVRVNHSLIYPNNVQGWGFSLLANLDDQGRVVDFAINEITPGEIRSELNGITSLTIHDSDLTAAVCGSGGYATAPRVRRCGECRRAVTRSLPEGEAFSLGIDNAVAGFVYNVLECDVPNGEYRPSKVMNIVSAESGDLDFEIPIDPNSKAKFYKVEVKPKD